ITFGPDKGLRLSNKARVQEAESLIAHAIDLLGPGGSRRLLAHLHRCRGLIHNLLGRKKDAELEFQAVQWHALGDPESLLQQALIYRERKDVDRAIENI